jgi:hypothetical protein
MVPVCSRNLLAGILATQHGDARPDGQEGFRHCLSADRSAGLLGPGAADTEAKDKEVAQAGLGVRDVTEGRVMTEGLAEGDPGLEGGETGSASLGDKSGVCGLQRRAEIRTEAISGRRVCRCQGAASG